MSMGLPWLTQSSFRETPAMFLVLDRQWRRPPGQANQPSISTIVADRLSLGRLLPWKTEMIINWKYHSTFRAVEDNLFKKMPKVISLSSLTLCKTTLAWSLSKKITPSKSQSKLWVSTQRDVSLTDKELQIVGKTSEVKLETVESLMVEDLEEM